MRRSSISGHRWGKKRKKKEHYGHQSRQGLCRHTGHKRIIFGSSSSSHFRTTHFPIYLKLRHFVIVLVTCCCLYFFRFFLYRMISSSYNNYIGGKKRTTTISLVVVVAGTPSARLNGGQAPSNRNKQPYVPFPPGSATSTQSITTTQHPGG